MGVKETKKPFYRHFIAEVDCDSKAANSLKWLDKKARLFLGQLGIKVINEISHQFEPHGLSLLYILSSSHMAVHTWPEDKYLHIDLIICSRTINLVDVESSLKMTFHGLKYKSIELNY